MLREFFYKQKRYKGRRLAKFFRRLVRVCYNRGLR
jgi:hypothetical protein